jgi:hypothetical protein
MVQKRLQELNCLIKLHVYRKFVTSEIACILLQCRRPTGAVPIQYTKLLVFSYCYSNLSENNRKVR